MTLAPAEAIVLAGGAGTRLRSVLPDLPKVLAPVGGRPFLYRLLDQLAAQGIEAVVLATGFGAEAVESAARRWQGTLRITVSREAVPLGTGRAIASAFDHVHDDRAWVFNGDSFCAVDLSAVAAEAAEGPEDAWLVAVEVADASRFGTIELSGSRVGDFVEKTGRHEPGLINAGIYLIPRERMSTGHLSIERDLFPLWAQQGRLRAVKVRSCFIDIGTPESLAGAEAFFE